MEMSIVFTAIWIIFYLNRAIGFNIDTVHPIIYGDPRAQVSRNAESHFGYTVQLLFSKTARIPRKWVLIGAPKSNSSYPDHQHLLEPGQVYRCDLGSVQTDKCQPILLEQSNGDRKHQSWLGGTVAAASPQKGSVVVCGHRWSNKKFESSLKRYLMNGACYLSEHDVPVDRDWQKRVPLESLDLQLDTNDFLYAYGQAGISAQVVTIPGTDKEEVIIGAPGVYNWTGSVIRLKDFKDFNPGNQRRKRQADLLPLTNVADVKKMPQLKPDDYFGYSVHSGMFFREHKAFYVSGAPRAANLKGKVFIFELLTDNTMDIRVTKEGNQLGEYFGANVLPIDLNNDEFDDLLVGAPLHSAHPDFADRSGDEGKVYVYINKQHEILEESTSLVGSQSSGARFGSAIASVGDMNKDGYRDFAVGAPYEDGSGAIYLYLGGKQGVHYHPINGYWQRIAAADFPFQPKGFGISVSAADIDSNEYPDIAVGSYLSNQAVVFRSKPILGLNMEIRTEPSSIDPKTTKSTRMEICVNSTSPTQEPANICVAYTLRADIDYPISRVGIKTEDSNVPLPFTFNQAQKRGQRVCRTLAVLLTSKDYSHPIRFRLTAEILRSSSCSKIPLHQPGSQAIYAGASKKDSFCNDCPTLDQRQLNYKEHTTTIVTGCGDDNKCTADLQIEANFEKKSFIIGSSETVKVQIKVTNHAEPAYVTTVDVRLPGNVNIRQGGICRYADVSFSCSLADNLDTQQVASVDLELDVSGLESGEYQLQIELEARTASDSVSNSRHRKNITLVLPLETSVDVGIAGVAVREQQPYQSPNETFAGPERVAFQHLYEVQNHGPSTVKSVRIDIWVPVNITTESGVLDLVERGIFVQVTQNSRVITACTGAVSKNLHDDDLSGRISRSGRRKRQAIDTNDPFSKDHMESVNCSTKGVSCMQITCMVGSLNRKSPAIVTINSTLLLRNARQLIKGRDVIVVSTNAKATITQQGINQETDEFPDTANATSTFLPETIHVVVGAWVAPLAVLAGVLLLILLSLLLHKLGFFKRHRYHDDIAENELEVPCPEVPTTHPEAPESTETPPETDNRRGHNEEDDIERLDF